MRRAILIWLAALVTGVVAQGASIGITFGDGAQGPHLGSPAGPGVKQDYWNNVDVRPWRTSASHVNAAGIHVTTGYGPCESSAPTVVATRDSANRVVNIGFLSYNPAQITSRRYNSVWGGFSGTAPAGPNTAAYDTKKLSWDPGWKDGQNWAKFTGIPYTNYTVYIWATGLTTGQVDTGVYFNGATNFTKQTGSEFYLVGNYNERTISYVQFVETIVPVKAVLLIVR